MDVAKEWRDLLFGVRRSVRYHSRRRMFFGRLGKLTNFVSIVFGSATVVAVLSSRPTWATAAAIIIAASGALDIVVGTSTAACEHQALCSRFIALEKEMTRVGEPTEKDVKTYARARLDIETEEPPPLRVLDSICHNELARAEGYPKTDWVGPITPVQRLCAPFFDFRDERIVSLGNQGATREANAS